MSKQEIDMEFFDNIDLDLGVRRSISYAKARSAIEQTMENRKAKRQAKLIVIDFLEGKVVEEPNQRKHGPEDAFGNHINRKSVEFIDGSKARF